jgi:cytochrome d ubiquinol oxidase subunit II
MKTEGELQQKAIGWARNTLTVMFVGILSVSLANVMLSPEILEKWLVMPNALLVLPFPVLAAMFYWLSHAALKELQQGNLRKQNRPFAYAVGTFVVTFAGLGFSYFPDVVPGHMTIWQAVAAPEALNFMLYGAIIVVPTILAYTAYSYRVFWGKVQELRYY